MMTTSSVNPAHEECPQCHYPHMAIGHQRCISCGWVRGTEVTPPAAGLPPANLPGDATVSIEQRIQAQQWSKLQGEQK